MRTTKTVDPLRRAPGAWDIDACPRKLVEQLENLCVMHRALAQPPPVHFTGFATWAPASGRRLEATVGRNDIRLWPAPSGIHQAQARAAARPRPCGNAVGLTPALP